MLDSILQYSQFAAGVVLLLFSVLQVTYKKKTLLNFNLAGTYFCLTFIIWYLWLLHTGFIIHFRYLIHQDVTVTFAIGPFAYFYFRAITGIDNLPFRKYLLNFLPVPLCLAVILLINVSDNSIFRYYILNRTTNPNCVVSPAIILLDHLSNISILCYLSIAIRDFYTLSRDNKDHKSIHEIKVILVYVLLVAFCIAAILFASIIDTPVIVIISIDILTMLGIWYFLFSFRYPDFTQKAVKEAKLLRYESAPLASDDVDGVLERIKRLMDEDKLYTDESLTLQKMSSFMGITPHHLSRIINQNMNTTFPSFLNAYRIAEAQNLLMNNPDMSVIEVMYRIGFNSKSSFNTLFSKITGLSPREFRKGKTRKK